MRALRRFLPLSLAVLTFLVALWTLPAAWCRRGAEAWFSGELSVQESLARTVAEQLQAELGRKDFHTGSERFDGEWLFGTNLMAAIGLCQLIKQHPETADRWTPAIDTAIRQILSDKVRAFDDAAWNENALTTLAGPNGHAAYLGYLNFLLGLYREINPANPFATLHDEITAALLRRFTSSPTGLLATYPGEWYPVDNAPGLASLALHARATGRDYSAVLNKLLAEYRRRCVDSRTRLLIQAMNAGGEPRDLPRGSGTALAVFFINQTFPDLGRTLFDGIRNNLERDVFGFGAIREFPCGVKGYGDIDSGPIVFGFGFSATGFSISGARAYGDARLYAKLYASAVLAGAPTLSRDRTDFLTAGPLGNAIMLAVLTTPRQP